jgi:hypothetical protein
LEGRNFLDKEDHALPARWANNRSRIPVAMVTVVAQKLFLSSVDIVE